MSGLFYGYAGKKEATRRWPCSGLFKTVAMARTDGFSITNVKHVAAEF
jgi:hypothetical protein